MLRHTFCHLPGIGGKTEQRLWATGLLTWEDALGARQRRVEEDLLLESARRHAAPDPAWFAQRLPARESWRLFADFRSQCAYLDVETTGMSGNAEVTTVALYDGQTVRTYVQGQNLDEFVRDVAGYQLLVTYNGKSFDLPVLRRCLGCPLEQAHVDLRHVLAGLGLRGGLKACEHQMGITRPGLEDVDGYTAVLLWHDYRRRRDRRALETLLAYNVQDAISLESLMVHAHNTYLKRLGTFPFATDCQLPPAVMPASPFTHDPETIRRVRCGSGSLAPLSRV